MFYRMTILPAEMPRNDISGMREYSLKTLDRSRPGIRVRIGKIPDRIGFGTFYKTSSIQDTVPGEKDNDIVLRVSLSGIKRPKAVVSNPEAGVLCKDMLRLRLAFERT